MRDTDERKGGWKDSDVVERDAVMAK
jgi:hypothetical protein